MNGPTNYGNNDIVTAVAAGVAAVLVWIASLVGPLKSLGIDNLGARIVAVALLALAVIAWRLYGRHAALHGLLQVRPLCLYDIDTVVLGDVKSELASRDSHDGKARYVERNSDDMLAKLLRSHQIVILIGASSSGKSATACEVASQVAPNVKTFVPRKPTQDVPKPLTDGLKFMSARHMRRAPAWLWLDDLGHYLERDPIDAALIRRWLAGHPDRRIVATLSSEERDRLEHDKSAVGASAKALFDMARTHQLSLRWYGAELRRAHEAYPKAGEGCNSLGRHLSSGDFHLHRFLDAEGSCPEAAAILQAATDWRRAGLLQPIPIQFLRKAFEVHLSSVAHAADLDAIFARGLEWATDPRDHPDAVLQRVSNPPDCVIIAEVAVEAATERSMPILKSTWELLLAEVRGSLEQVAVANAARAFGYPELARTTLEGMLENQALPSAVQGSARAAWTNLQEPALGIRGDFGSSRQDAAEIDLGFGGQAPEDDDPVRGFPLLWLIYRRPEVWVAGRVAALIFLDLLGIWLALIAAYCVTRAPRHFDYEAIRTATDKRVLFVAFLVVLLFSRSGLYRHIGRRRNQARILATLFQGALLLVAVRLLGVEHIGSYALIGWTLVFACITVTALRGVFNRVTVWAGNAARGRRMRCALIGRREQVEVVASIMREDDSTRRLVGFIGAAPTEECDGRLRHLGEMNDPQDLAEIIQRHELDELVLCDSVVSEDTASKIADVAWDAGAELQAVAPGRSFLVTVSRYTAGDALPFEDLRFPVFDVVQLATKRVFDIVMCLAFAVVWVPLYMLVRGAVRLTSKGPAVQEVSYPGLGGVPFGMLKFRTHHISTTDADLGPHTKVGSAIEAFGLDELPQLLNVLKGDMSLVGPRPVRPADFDRLEPWQKNRNLVPPGITGLWQISGRADRDLAAMVRLDFYYVQRWSVFLDIEILLRTIPTVLRRRQAQLLHQDGDGAERRATRERRAAFAPSILDGLSREPGLTFDDVVELAVLHGGRPSEALCWLALLEGNHWLETRTAAPTSNATLFVLSEDARARLASDIRVTS